MRQYNLLIKESMKKQVKKIGKYYFYKQNKRYQDEFTSLFEGKHYESGLLVMIYRIDRKKIDDKEQLNDQFKRKVSLVKRSHSKVFDQYHQISVTDHHYYIVLQEIKPQTLQKKLLSHALNLQDIARLLYSFKLIFEGMKKIKSYHGQKCIKPSHINPKLIKMERKGIKIDLINLRSFESLQKVKKKDQYSTLKMVDNMELAYYPPEVLKYKRFSQKTDCWSFGVILYKSIYGEFPWDIKSITINQFIENAIDNDIQFSQKQGISSQLIHLIYGCLKGDQDLRFCYDDILNHEIYKSQKIKILTLRHQSNTSSTPCQSISSMRTLNEQQNH